MKEFLIKDEPAFKIRVKIWPCKSPDTLYAVNFTQETYGEDNEIAHVSTYEFFLTKEEIAKLSEGLK